MTGREKCARLGVGSSTVALVGYLSLIPIRGPQHAMAALAALALYSLAPVFRSREPADERDVSVHRRAVRVGAMAFVIVVSVSIAIYAAAQAGGRHGQVPGYAVISLGGTSTAMFILVKSVTILLLYRGHGESDHG